MNLSSGSQQLSVSQMCPYTSWHQSPSDWPQAWTPKLMHLIKVPLCRVYLLQALTGSSGASFGPRWVKENQGMSVVDGRRNVTRTQCLSAKTRSATWMHPCGFQPPSALFSLHLCSLRALPLTAIRAAGPFIFPQQHVFTLLLCWAFL